MNGTEDAVAFFEDARSGLMGLAYRLLGSRADAEDAVQETFLRWSQADRSGITAPLAWLRTVCTRYCLDLLKSPHRSRVAYVGTWLPEPLHTVHDPDGDGSTEFSATLTTAFLLLLERLTPKERAAYLLHEFFGMSYPEISSAIGIKEPACRQLVSRARTHVERSNVRQTTTPARQETLLAAFEAAVRDGSPRALTGLLSADIRLCTEGGEGATAIRRVLVGSDQVIRFVKRGLHRWWSEYSFERAYINATLGLIVRDSSGGVVATASFSYDESGCIDGIYIMRNPRKLGRVDEVAPHVH